MLRSWPARTRPSSYSFWTPAIWAVPGWASELQSRGVVLGDLAGVIQVDRVVVRPTAARANADASVQSKVDEKLIHRIKDPSPGKYGVRGDGITVGEH